MFKLKICQLISSLCLIKYELCFVLKTVSFHLRYQWIALQKHRRNHHNSLLKPEYWRYLPYIRSRFQGYQWASGAPLVKWRVVDIMPFNMCIFNLYCLLSLCTSSQASRFTFFLELCKIFSLTMCSLSVSLI